VIYIRIEEAVRTIKICNFSPETIIKMVWNEICNGCSKNVYLLTVYPATNATYNNYQNIFHH
jgi:hypothetical protein